MKLAIIPLTLLPTVFAVAIGISNDPFNESPSHGLSKEFSNLISNMPSNDPNELSNDPSEFLAPLNIDFQTNKVMEMEALNFITNLTNTLISEVTQYAQQAGLNAEELISFPCTPIPDKKEKRAFIQVHPFWHRLGVKLVLKYNTKKPFMRACLAVLKGVIEGKNHGTSTMTNSTMTNSTMTDSTMTNSTMRTADSTIHSDDTVSKTNLTSYY